MNTDHAQTTDGPETDLPSVTVVTVVYNDAHNIEKTLLSVINQQYPNLEYIVIDGGSTDGTVDIIKKYEKRITHWISEKDSGIYDAMNKGIDLASGEWINFMNAKDMFFSTTTICDVFKDYPKHCDFIYGSYILTDKYEDTYVPMHHPIDKIWQGMLFCHQTLFSKTELLKQNKFCVNNKIISDYKSVFLHYLEGKNFFNCDKTIAIVATGGVSDNFFPRIFERWRFVRKHMNYKADIFYIGQIVLYLLKNYAPPRITNLIYKKFTASKPFKKVTNTPLTALIKKK